MELEYEYIVLDKMPDHVLQWLVTTYGPSGKRWFYLNHCVFFKNNKDLIWFELRWL
jgi:hypothetical protein